MSNPGSSGTAYSIVSSWLQAWGEEKAWEFMAGLDKNIKMYTQSGSRPAEMAARGETVIGISEAAFARTLGMKGAPLEVVVLDNPVPLDMEASAVIKGTAKLEAAQKLLDFSVSPEMAAIVGARSCVTARPEITEAEARKIPEVMGNYDFAEAAQKRQETIEAWRGRFDVR
jgi:ABC-type Fe3+ transport system, periplasmic component